MNKQARGARPSRSSSTEVSQGRWPVLYDRRGGHPPRWTDREGAGGDRVLGGMEDFPCEEAITLKSSYVICCLTALDHSFQLLPHLHSFTQQPAGSSGGGWTEAGSGIICGREFFRGPGQGAGPAPSEGNQALGRPLCNRLPPHGVSLPWSPLGPSLADQQERLLAAALSAISPVLLLPAPSDCLHQLGLGSHQSERKAQKEKLTS